MRSDSQERRMAMIAHDQPYWAACARVAVPCGARTSDSTPTTIP